MNYPKIFRTTFQLITALAISALLSACGGGGSSGSNGSGGGGNNTPTTNFTISGKVTGAMGTTTVTLTQTNSTANVKSMPIGADGSYSFTVAIGDYTVTPSDGMTNFDPKFRDVKKSDTVLSGLNFSVMPNPTPSPSPSTYTLSGKVTGATVANNQLVSVNLAGPGTTTTNTSTDAQGNYSFTGLLPGVYTATPVPLSGYRFSGIVSTTIIDKNTAFLDIVSTAATITSTYTIAGTVTGAPAGLMVYLTGAATTSTQTIANGTYSFSGLNNGNYTVTPATAANNNTYTISPNMGITVTVLNGAITPPTADFTATLVSGGGGGTLPPPPSTKSFTLIHFNDLHAHLTEHLDRVKVNAVGSVPASTKVEMRGGLARAKTLIDTIRASAGVDANKNSKSILMNIGDTYHGGVEALFSIGNDIVDPVNALGIDIGVPGNWDFAYGPLITRARYPQNPPLPGASNITTSGLGGRFSNTVKMPTFRNLAANVTSSTNAPFLDATWIKQIDGITIGFIGITSDIVTRMSPVLGQGLVFLEDQSTPPVREAAYIKLIQDLANQLRTQQKAQFVFVMSELGIHKDKQIADKIAKKTVDGFFSAHTHEATFDKIISKSEAFVVEAGNDGYIGAMKVTVSPDAAVAPVFDWKLMTLDSSIAQDPTMLKMVTDVRAKYLATNPNIKFPLPSASATLSQSIDTPVGKTRGALDRRQALESSFNREYTDALRNYVEAKIPATSIMDANGKPISITSYLAMTPGFRFDSVIPEDNTVTSGIITLEDVYRFFPVIYTISTGQITGDKLKTNIEDGLTYVFSTDASKLGGGWFEGYSGINLTVNLKAPDGTRVTSATRTLNTGGVVNFDFNNTAIYNVVGCSRPGDNFISPNVICSYPGFTNITPLINPDTTAAFTVQEMFVKLLPPKGTNGNFPLLPAGTNHHTDTSGLIMWPETPFVQPIW